MEFDRMLAELFQEEDRAREMASRLMQVAQTSREAANAERESLLAFLRGPMERHMAYEERAIFPHLERHGLAPEVQVALKQHFSLRKATEHLAALPENASAAGPGADDVAGVVFDIARLMLHHTNFEGDYIYPELSHAEWRDLMRATVEPVVQK
jgi:hypothetical protein